MAIRVRSIIGGATNFFANLTEALFLANLLDVGSVFVIHRYHADGPVADAYYKVVATEPTGVEDLEKFQLSNTKWAKYSSFEIRPEHFGAYRAGTGNDPVDDYNALDTSIKVAMRERRCYHGSEGTYYCTQPLTLITVPIHIENAGRYRTYYRMAPTLDGALFSTSELWVGNANTNWVISLAAFNPTLSPERDYQGFAFRDCTIYGHREATEDAGIIQHGLVLYDRNDFVTVDNVTFDCIRGHGFAHGIRLNAVAAYVRQSTFRDIMVERCGEVGYASHYIGTQGQTSGTVNNVNYFDLQVYWTHGKAIHIYNESLLSSGRILRFHGLMVHGLDNTPAIEIAEDLFVVEGKNIGISVFGGNIAAAFPNQWAVKLIANASGSPSGFQWHGFSSVVNAFWIEDTGGDVLLDMEFTRSGNLGTVQLKTGAGVTGEIACFGTSPENWNYDLDAASVKYVRKGRYERPPTFTVATIPAASGYTGRFIYVSDGDSGNPGLAYSNGSAWHTMRHSTNVPTSNTFTLFGAPNLLINGDGDTGALRFQQKSELNHWLDMGRININSVFSFIGNKLGGPAFSAMLIDLINQYIRFPNGLRLGSVNSMMTSGTGDPESVVTANVGSIYFRDDGGAGTYIYRKNTGTGNTGWAALV